MVTLGIQSGYTWLNGDTNTGVWCTASLTEQGPKDICFHVDTHIFREIYKLRDNCIFKCKSILLSGGFLYKTYSAAQKKTLQATDHLLLERKVLCQQEAYPKRIFPYIQMFPILN